MASSTPCAHTHRLTPLFALVHLFWRAVVQPQSEAEARRHILATREEGHAGDLLEQRRLAHRLGAHDDHLRKLKLELLELVAELVIQLIH